MSGLAEDDIASPTPLRTWLLRGVLGLLLVALIGGAAWWLRNTLGAETKPVRQVAKITILPDTPPPPPPPPPREEPRPQPQDKAPAPVPDAPKPQAAPPADAPIKMEGAAGDGPSPFAAGSVQREYQSGPAVAGGTGGGSAGDRMQERLFVQSARQQIQAEIERNLRSEAVELVATFSLWLGRDGAIERFELAGSDNPRHDADLRTALDATSRSLRLSSPPSGMPQPLRFRLTVRPLG